MKYSVEVETDSRVYQSPGGSGYGTPANGRGGTPSRQLNWAIEVDILTGEPMLDKTNKDTVTAEKVSKRIAARAVNEPGAVKRVSRMERKEELIQRAMRKKSRKVSMNLK